MNTETKTVTATHYVVTLTEAEAREIIADPTDLQMKLRVMLSGAPARVNGYGRNYPKPKKEKPVRAPKGPAGKGGFAKSPCPECGRSAAGSQMKTHRMRKHGVPAAKSSESN